MKQQIDILIPVYDGYEETVQCIESVLDSDLNENIFLNVINDSSPNEKLTIWLRDASKKHEFSLYENEVNLGFVQTVNRGMVLHEERDVILLNSDTVVAGDWVQRMAAHVEKDAKISSVTPFSNNATICSFPNFCEENELLPYPVGLIDQAFAKANSGEFYEIPTAIGFCMYITRSSMDDVGLFDADTFGRGYGEENDFCMRTIRAGWKHIVSADVFVAHVGGVSFSEEKNARVQAAQGILDKLYPEYHRLVHEFITENPLIPYRIKAYAELIRLTTNTKTNLLISHNLGGGVEKHVKELSCYLAEGGFFPIIRPAASDGKFEFAFSPESKDKIHFSIPEDYQKIVSLCSSIGVGRVYVHHTMGINPELMNLAEDLDCAMDYMIHDYYLINANPTLTSEEGMFCEDVDARDELCAKNYKLPFGISAQKWRESQEVFLNKCERILAPSQYTAKLFQEYFQSCNVSTVYHPDSLLADYPEPKPSFPVQGRDVKVLVLGAISREKGADILEETSLLAKNNNLHIQFHLLGYAYRPLESVIEHGAYNDNNVDEKIGAISPDIIWYPALWPETYSYTLSEGLRTGLPIIASNLGAFPERLKGRMYSDIGDWKNSAEAWLSYFYSSIENWGSLKLSGQEWRNIYDDSSIFYQIFWDRVKPRDGIPVDLSGLLFRGPSEKPNKKEKLLLFLMRVRNVHVVRWIVKKIPVSLQRRLKRYLSKKPLHELLIRKG